MEVSDDEQTKYVPLFNFKDINFWLALLKFFTCRNHIRNMYGNNKLLCGNFH